MSFHYNILQGAHETDDARERETEAFISKTNIVYYFLIEDA